MPGEKTPEEKKKTIDAQKARARYRRGAMLDRVYQKLSDTGKSLNPEQMQVLRAYWNGDLKEQANKATLDSGNGRLRRGDDTGVDIGGSTGGFLRVVLDDWEPPNTEEFQ